MGPISLNLLVFQQSAGIVADSFGLLVRIAASSDFVEFGETDLLAISFVFLRRVHVAVHRHLIGLTPTTREEVGKVMEAEMSGGVVEGQGGGESGRSGSRCEEWWK